MVPVSPNGPHTALITTTSACGSMWSLTPGPRRTATGIWRWTRLVRVADWRQSIIPGNNARRANSRASMKHTIWISAGCAGAMLLMAQQQSQTSPPPAAPAQQGGGFGGFGRGGPPFDYADNEGWVSLFDGQSLNGWDGDTRFWSARDGAIYVEPTCEKPTGTIYLIWQGGETSDFMLKFESKGTGNVNGGLQFRSYMTADNNVLLKYPGRGGGGFASNRSEERRVG